MIEVPNPATDQQAIFRAYRYGLRHEHTIYRLVSDGTPEARVFSHCLSKEWMAKKVVDEAVPTRQNITTVNLNCVQGSEFLSMGIFTENQLEIPMGIFQLNYSD